MKLKRQVINKWLTVCAPPVANDIPDYDGSHDYEAEVLIYDQIGDDYYGMEGIAAGDFKSALDSLKGKKVLARIHSPGGNVYDGMAIYNAIKEHGNVDTKIDGIAASAAFSVFQGGNKRIMSGFSMGMIHRASSLMIGNSKAMANESKILAVHDEAIANMLAVKSGKSVESCMNAMDKETWMTSADCKAQGFCDELTEGGEEPENKFDLSRFNNVPKAAARFNITNNKEIIMNRAQMIALLKGAKVNVADDATDKWLIEQVTLLAQRQDTQSTTVIQPATTITQAATVATQAASSVVAANGATVAIPSNVIDLQNRIAQLESQNVNVRVALITARVDKCIENDQCPGVQRDWLIQASLKDEKLLETFEMLTPRLVGNPPVSNVSVETSPVEDIGRAMNQNRDALGAYMKGRHAPTQEVRNAIGIGASRTARMVRDLTTNLTKDIPKGSGVNTTGYEDARLNRIADWLERSFPRQDGGAMNRQNATTTYDGVSVDTLLQRQVIMSEAMRAFRRKLWPLESFAHYFGNVPLQGTDQVVVPYYPLFTTQSLRFVQGTGAGQGYQSNGTDSASQKSITVGGVGGTVKSAGIDRAYQPMTWSAYLLRRQPWIDILKLVVMRVEQLALDVLTDITGAWVLKANFGNSVWQGTPSGFDSTAIAALRGIAEKKDWPEAMRNLVILTDYYVNLLTDNSLKAYLNIGDTGVIREGRVGGIYGFADTISNPRIPATTDGDLVGWISYPSAVLVATAPILPAPGELKLMVSYDVITDDQIGLSFEYKYFGQPQYSQDTEIVECNYGSGLGELAALGRITNGGV